MRQAANIVIHLLSFLCAKGVSSRPRIFRLEEIDIQDAFHGMRLQFVKICLIFILQKILLKQLKSEKNLKNSFSYNPKGVRSFSFKYNYFWVGVEEEKLKRAEPQTKNTQCRACSAAKNLLFQVNHHTKIVFTQSRAQQG